ncbi:TPA: hypothetical protein HA251_01985 [Candidatus Woesearchaeota archaeon]|nr:hypothetical protein [Candidatus Woesearchaeota archaeon]
MATDTTLESIARSMRAAISIPAIDLATTENSHDEAWTTPLLDRIVADALAKHPLAPYTSPDEMPEGNMRNALTKLTSTPTAIDVPAEYVPPPVPAMPTRNRFQRVKDRIILKVLPNNKSAKLRERIDDALARKRIQNEHAWLEQGYKTFDKHVDVIRAAYSTTASYVKNVREGITLARECVGANIARIQELTLENESIGKSYDDPEYCARQTTRLGEETARAAITKLKERVERNNAEIALLARQNQHAAPCIAIYNSGVESGIAILAVTEQTLERATAQKLKLRAILHNYAGLTRGEIASANATAALTDMQRVTDGVVRQMNEMDAKFYETHAGYIARTTQNDFEVAPNMRAANAYATMTIETTTVENKQRPKPQAEANRG